MGASERLGAASARHARDRVIVVGEKGTRGLMEPRTKVDVYWPPRAGISAIEERKSRERPLPAGLLLSGTLTTRRTAGWAPCMGVSRAVVVSMEQGALLSSRIFETEKSAGSRNDSPGDFTEHKT